MSAEIKPCPFCGKPATPWEAGKMANCELHCGDIFPMPIQWWNTRPIEDALRAENERLRAALEKIAGVGEPDGSWLKKDYYTALIIAIDVLGETK